MYVRCHKRNERVIFSLMVSRREAGQTKKDYVANLGSAPIAPTVGDRIAFWQQLHARVARLGNRVGPEDQAKIFAAIHLRVPMVTPQEQQSVQLRNAQSDSGFWQGLGAMNQSSADALKKIVEKSQRRIASFETGAADAKDKSRAAEDRAARIERGEDVPGGLGKQVTAEDMERWLLEDGWTKTDIKNMKLLGLLTDEEMEEIYAQIPKRIEMMDRAMWRQVRNIIVRKLASEEEGEE
jgi:hypothetical protein